MPKSTLDDLERSKRTLTEKSFYRAQQKKLSDDRHTTPPLFHPNFGGVPVAPDRPCWDQPGISLKNLFSKYSNYVITVPERHGRTDGQRKDRRHTVA